MALFIGGPLDGRLIEVDPSKTWLEVAVTPSESIEDLKIGKSPPATMPTKVFYYRRETLSCPSSVYSIFVPRTFNCEDVMEALIEGYRQGTVQNTVQE